MIYLDKNKIKYFTPYIISVLIFCGYLKLWLIYNHYDVVISDYLEMTEILLLFLPDIIFYGLLLGFVFLLGFLLESKSEENRIEEERNKIIVTDGFRKRIKMHYKFSKPLFITTGLMISYSIYLLIFKYEQFWNFLIGSILLPITLLFNIVMNEYKRKFAQVYDKPFDSTLNNLVLICFLFITNVLVSVPLEINKLDAGKSRSISFQYKDQIINTSDSLVFLGQTRNYLFIRNKVQKQTLIFPRNELSDLKTISHIPRKKN